MAEPAQPSQPTPRTVERSWAITAMIVVGLVLVLFGVVATVMGVSGSSALDIKIGTVELKTTGLGIICIVAGVVLAAVPFVYQIKDGGLGPFGPASR